MLEGCRAAQNNSGCSPHRGRPRPQSWRGALRQHWPQETLQFLSGPIWSVPPPQGYAETLQSETLLPQELDSPSLQAASSSSASPLLTPLTLHEALVPTAGLVGFSVASSGMIRPTASDFSPSDGCWFRAESSSLPSLCRDANYSCMWVAKLLSMCVYIYVWQFLHLFVYLVFSLGVEID